MSLIYRRCAGLDVHKESISVCARVRVGGQQPTMESATFGTFTCDLQAMAEWLQPGIPGWLGEDLRGDRAVRIERRTKALVF